MPDRKVSLVEVVKHSLPYKQELDGLRGVAIFLVVLFHIWPDYFSFGFVGVDIFFVLSGYLITKIIWTKQEKGNFSYLVFYRNRIRRIFPALILVLLTTMLVGQLFLFPTEYELLGKHIKSSALFYQNFRLIDEAGYWDESSQLKPLLHFWSLSIEEQFYVFWPLLIAVVFFLKKHCITCIFIALMLGIFELYLNEIGSFYHSMSRFWELAAGGTIVWLERNDSLISWLGRKPLAIWLLFAGAISLSLGNQSYDFSALLLVVIATMLLLLSLKNRSDKLLKNKVLVFLGLISFPLYLWHYPVVSYAHIFGISVKKNGILIFMVSVILSYLTYRFVEVYARKQTNIKIIAGLFLSVIIIAGIGQFIRKNGGIPERTQLSAYNAMSPQLKKIIPTDQMCKDLILKLTSSPMSFSQCRTTSKKINEKFVALIGDSHAYVMFESFARQLKTRGYELILLSRNSCPVFINGARGRNVKESKMCAESIQQIYETLEHINGLEKVIVASRGPVYTLEKGFGTSEAMLLDNPIRHIKFYEMPNFQYDSEQLFFLSIRSTISFFMKKNIEVFLFLENPELGFDIKWCIRRPFDLFLTKCSIPYDLYQKRMSRYRENMYALSQDNVGVSILDPEALMCDKLNCYAADGNSLYYADDDHLSVYGSDYLAQNFINTIVADRNND